MIVREIHGRTISCSFWLVLYRLIWEFLELLEFRQFEGLTELIVIPYFSGELISQTAINYIRGWRRGVPDPDQRDVSQR